MILTSQMIVIRKADLFAETQVYVSIVCYAYCINKHVSRYKACAQPV